jgi:septal ring factor EnvC (AmiA/AmiB activator)
MSQGEITKRQDELSSIRDQIRQYELKIKEQQRTERSTLDLLDSYDRKANLVRKLVRKLRAEEAELQDTIAATREELKSLDAQLEFLKKHYAAYVKSVYIAGRLHDTELLFSSNSINQYYVRNVYLQRFSQQRKRDAERIGNQKDAVSEIEARLEVQLDEERRLIAEKNSEENRLVALAADRKRVLVQVRRDKNTTQREIDRKTRAARELEGVIARLIEAERVKKEREAAQAREKNLPRPPVVIGHFEAKRGKLRWPVSEGAVVAHFGNQIHPRLKTVTQNTGIDIQVKVGTPVTAVAEGEVSTILWYPSYGNILIVNHYGGFRTVYTHLSEILVIEGQKVKEGQQIGESGESLEGPRLHFELWKDREKQNPEAWLAQQ